MERSEIYDKLNEIFRDVLDNDEIELTDAAKADDIEEWMIAGINAMMDKVNEMKEGVPYDLPTVIYKMLTYADK